MLVALVAGMNSHSGVSQQGFGPRSGNHDELVSSWNRVPDMPQVSLTLLVNGFQVADGRAALRTPIHNVMSTIDQAIFVQAHEDLGDGARQLRRQRKSFARPVAAFAQLQHLPRDGSAGLGFPLPNFLLE